MEEQTEGISHSPSSLHDRGQKEEVYKPVVRPPKMYCLEMMVSTEAEEMNMKIFNGSDQKEQD